MFSKTIGKLAVFLSLLFISAWAFAQSSQSLGDLATNITGSMSAITTFLTAGAYVGGVCFFIVAVFQFKQHKENPQQNPLSKPMMILAMATALIFLPTFIGSVSTTIFGSSSTSGGAAGFQPGSSGS